MCGAFADYDTKQEKELHLFFSLMSARVLTRRNCSIVPGPRECFTGVFNVPINWRTDDGYDMILE